MFILIVLAGVDLLLPAVQIPLVAWCILLFLLVCYKSVLEAKPKPIQKELSPSKPEIFRELAWIVSTEHRGVYSTPDGKWQLVASPQEDDSNVYSLYSDDEETCIFLTANTLDAAFDQADMIIATLTPESSKEENK